MPEVVKPSDEGLHPLQIVLRDEGYHAYTAACKKAKKANEIYCIQDRVVENTVIGAIVHELNSIPEDEVMEANIPKTDDKGKIIRKGMFADFEKRMVFKRDYRKDQLLRQHNVTVEQLVAWEVRNKRAN